MYGGTLVNATCKLPPLSGGDEALVVFAARFMGGGGGSRFYGSTRAAGCRSQRLDLT